MRIVHETTTLMLSSTVGFNNSGEITLDGVCSLNVGDVRLPLNFLLTNKTGSKKKKEPGSNKIMNLTIVVDVRSDAEVDSDDEEGESFIWYTEIENWDFCLVKVKFYDRDDRMVFTKFLHLDRQEDCGCEADYPDKRCSQSNMTKLRHSGRISVQSNSCCSMDEVERLCRPHISEEFGYQIKLEVDLVLRTADNTQRPKGEEQVIRRRTDDPAVNNPDMTFKIVKTEETVSAHQNFVKGRSKLLKTLLESPWSEEAEKGEILVMADWVTGTILEDFLDGLYGFWKVADMVENYDNLFLLLQRLNLCYFYQCHNDLIDHIIGTIVGRPNSSFDLSSALNVYRTGCLYKNSCLQFRSLQWLVSERKSRRGTLTLTPEQKKQIDEFLTYMTSKFDDFDRRPIMTAAGLRESKKK